MRHRWQIFGKGPRAGSLLKGKEFIENVDRVVRLWDNVYEHFAYLCNLSTDSDRFEIIDYR